MKYKATATICSILLILCMSGCQLAKEDAGLHTETDRLAGVFLTEEYLDNFDPELYFTENMSALQNQEITPDHDINNNQSKRIYAKLVDEQNNQNKTYVFEGLKGMSFFSVTIPEENEFQSYKTAVIDDAIRDVHIAYDFKDGGEELSLEGGVYLTPEYTSRIIYVNPVYQSNDGKVYTVSGKGVMLSNADYSEGENMNETLSDSETINDRGKSHTYVSTIKLAFNTIFRPAHIIIFEMDEASNIINRQVYTPGRLPEQLVLKKETTFIIAETQKKDNNGNPVISREIFSPDDEDLKTYFANENNICLEQLTTLIWAGN